VQHNVKSIQSIYATLSIIYNILTKRFKDKQNYFYYMNFTA